MYICTSDHPICMYPCIHCFAYSNGCSLAAIPTYIANFCPDPCGHACAQEQKDPRKDGRIDMDLVEVGVSIQQEIWVYDNDLTATSLGIMVFIGNHSQMALVELCELS